MSHTTLLSNNYFEICCSVKINDQKNNFMKFYVKLKIFENKSTLLCVSKIARIVI
jgi:hypothetical protein